MQRTRTGRRAETGACALTTAGTQDARSYARRPARPRPAVGAPRPPQRPLGGARWGPARPARSFTYSKRHPCGRPTAPTSWALLPFPSPAGAPGTPTSSAPLRPGSRPAFGPAAADAAAAASASRDPRARRRLGSLRRHHHSPRLFRPAGLRPQPGARRLCHPLGPLPVLHSPRWGGRSAHPPARGARLRRRGVGPAPLRPRDQSDCGPNSLRSRSLDSAFTCLQDPPPHGGEANQITSSPQLKGASG